MTNNGKISLVWAKNVNGEFHRQESEFRHFISSSSDKFKPESGRYHLYVAHACPWAHRTLIVRCLKGLEDVISVSFVNHLLTEDGWHFDQNHKDDVYGHQYLRDLYYKTNPKYNARFTVPLLWDKKLQTAVNNESDEIMRMFNSEFNEFAKNPTLDLYPAQLSKEIDVMNDWVYDDFNNGVYKAGFATKQEPYELNCRKVFESLDKFETILTNNQWLINNQLTESDIRVFTTALRFDPVYVTHFKCNLKTIQGNYPNILKWMKRIYHLPGVKSTVNMDSIKKHYFLSHKEINPNGIVGLSNGPNLE